MEKIKGRAFLFGDNVDTDQILPGYAMSAPVEELKNFALKGSIMPDFPQRVKPGDIIVAGVNFGCGSSREQAPLALKQASVGAVVASSFAMIFRKNAVNIGLPVITSDYIEQIKKELQTGDEICVDIEKGELKLIATGKSYKLNKPSDATMETLKAGGLINKVKMILKEGGANHECIKA
jgi:3-isopropylmalate/(R)-2-methylmalate dehydratase small subunit